MTTFLAELRYAARVLWKHRGVNAVALITLALAIGANTAIFSVYNALLVRALPFPEPDTLVQVARRYRAASATRWRFRNTCAGVMGAVQSFRALRRTTRSVPASTWWELDRRID